MALDSSKCSCSVNEDLARQLSFAANLNSSMLYSKMQDETVKKSKEHQSLFRKLDKETQTLKSARGDVQQGPGLRKSRRRLADALFLDTISESADAGDGSRQQTQRG